MVENVPIVVATLCVSIVKSISHAGILPVVQSAVLVQLDSGSGRDRLRCGQSWDGKGGSNEEELHLDGVV